jgi:hypothetical protein
MERLTEGDHLRVADDIAEGAEVCVAASVGLY